MYCSAGCPNMKILNETSGVITSPFYPRNYPGDQRCSWQITASKGNHVVLIIEHMHVQQCGVSCTCDYLEIQNGSSFDSLSKTSGRRCDYYDYNYYLNYDDYNYFYYHYYYYYYYYYRYYYNCYDHSHSHYYYYYHYYYYCHWPLIFYSYGESLKVLFVSDGSSTKAYAGFKATYVQVNRTAIIKGKSVSEQGLCILAV